MEHRTPVSDIYSLRKPSRGEIATIRINDIEGITLSIHVGGVGAGPNPLERQLNRILTAAEESRGLPSAAQVFVKTYAICWIIGSEALVTDSRSARTSLIGGWPKKRLYSRLNCVGLS
jgi:hypothetical protein